MRALLRRPAGLVGLVLVTTILALALAAPWIAPFDPLAVDLRARLQAPSAVHWLGTDQTGRDLLSRILWGARPSLAVGLASVAIGLVGGCGIGLLAGYSRGWGAQAAMRAMDGLASIPLLIWAIAVLGIIGVGPVQVGALRLPNEAKVALLIGLFYMPPLARVTEGATRAEAAMDYVRARQCQGARTLSILLGDVLPNTLAPVIVQATLFVAVGIVVEASLSFIGLGVEPPAPSWGSMLADARGFVLTGQWWMPVCPGVAIFLTVVGFNLLGDGLRDALDPRRSAGAGRMGLVG